MRLFEQMFGDGSIWAVIASVVFIFYTILSLVFTSAILMRYFFSLGGEFVSATTDYPWEGILLTAFFLVMDSICIWPGMGALSAYVTLPAIFYRILAVSCVVTIWLTYMAAAHKSCDVPALLSEILMTCMFIACCLCI